MQKTPIDESLAFTALLTMDPVFRKIVDSAVSERISSLLKDWYAQEGEPSLWNFTAQWLTEEAATYEERCRPDGEADS